MGAKQKGKEQAEVTNHTKENSAARGERLSQRVWLSNATGFPGTF